MRLGRLSRGKGKVESSGGDGSVGKEMVQQSVEQARVVVKAWILYYPASEGEKAMEGE